jgi:Uma2 family endonuclease
MTGVPKAIGTISPEEYIEGELHSEVRHEYIDGYVYAMAGASVDHNRIAGNIFAELRSQLRNGPCEPFIGDVKVRIPPRFANAYYYPDVLVSRDPNDREKYFRERPAVIFEVVSPDTERTDKREKAISYRQIPGIAAYVIVEQDRAVLTVLRPAETGWESEILEGMGTVLKLPTIGVEIPLDRVYERTAVASTTP